LYETFKKKKGIKMKIITDKKYSIIYADPAWSYNDKGSRLSADEKYKTINLNEIKKLNINEITENDAILFIWATFPMIQEALDVIKAWGFKYKTLGFSWIKLNKNGTPCFGVGHYTRSNCEVCLIGVKGKGNKLIKNKSISSVVMSERKRHSEKPAEVRNKIVELCGDLPRIELFARHKIEGWDYFGNEIL
jgi:site-specific DNA-methyltransferase (adenine-specific)